MAVVKSIETVVPIKPSPLFDLAKLQMPEYKPFIYKSKLGFNDMLATGYLHAVAPYLTGVESEILVDEDLGERKIGNMIQRDRRVVTRVTITLAFRTTSSGIATKEMRFQGLAEGTTLETSNAVKDALIRVVETRALKRAIGRALDISSQAINGKVFVPEEEDGVSSEYEPADPGMSKPMAAPTAHPRPVFQAPGVASAADEDW